MTYKHSSEKYKEIIEEYEKAEQDLQDPSVIQNPQKLLAASRKHSDLKELYVLASKYLQNARQIEENLELQNSNDLELRDLAENEILDLTKKNTDLDDTLKTLLRSSDPNDKRDAILEIRAGTGGEEAALFAADLLRMYIKYAESKGWIIQTLSTSYTGSGGIKESIISLKGKDAYGKLKFENGVHRVQRIPSTESSGRIHTSAASVVVLPEVDDIPDIIINDQEIKVDVYRAGGPGGQSVNTTDSAVRITHLPTGIIVTCQDEKSQHKNKARALSVLKSRLFQLQQDEIAQKADSQRKSAIKSGDRSAKIRTYNFPQGRVTDHRIKKTWHNLNEILDGMLDEIILDTSKQLSNGIDM
ncbi:peptide chain release factor 1 [Candidatus Dojkabacteria bacterium]|nr:peptide chain release factor 1 [Candidatus Dojkabacteria bacterium]